MDYEHTLAHCRTALKPGGIAVFYEPVLEGKTITTLFMALMLRCDEMADVGQFSEADREKIRLLIRHQMKSAWLPQDRETLSKIEDKYIFEIAKMKQVGLDVGFTDVAFVNDPRCPPYWGYVTHPCQIHGVAPEKVRSFKWIEAAFAETYGRIFPEQLVAPTGYFVFRR